jgi:hypothetical protein
MKLKRSPLSVALIALAISGTVGIVLFMVFGDHSNSIHRSQANVTAGEYVGLVSAGIAAIAYFVQRRRVNAEWNAQTAATNSGAGVE